MDPYQSPEVPSGSYGAYCIADLDIGEILNQAIQLTKNHFGLLFGISAITTVPMMLVQMIVAALVAPNLAQAGGFNPQQGPAQLTPEMQAELIGFFVVVFPIGLIHWLVITPITNAATIHAIASKYLGAPVTIGTAYKKAFSRAPAVIGTWIVVYLAVVVGLLLCCVPGILAIFWFALATQVVVVEGLGIFDAMGRSRFLMKGNYLTLFVLFVIAIFTNASINFALGFGSTFIPIPYVATALQLLVTLTLIIVWSAVFVVFYFSARCKNENFDLGILAASVVESPKK
jgi:hypothetical protein